ncbi:hypothetical protein VNO78_23137 [Psophocarpus tetragonolobus]|uniref:Uncharacterized protein n=1 Tax=Psophocarpus tetragonolobus TaxID=3891 RepID=A0AAN9S647_PSOTE
MEKVKPEVYVQYKGTVQNGIKPGNNDNQNLSYAKVVENSGEGHCSRGRKEEGERKLGDTHLVYQAEADEVGSAEGRIIQKALRPAIGNDEQRKKGGEYGEGVSSTKETWRCDGAMEEPEINKTVSGSQTADVQKLEEGLWSAEHKKQGGNLTQNNMEVDKGEDNHGIGQRPIDYTNGQRPIDYTNGQRLTDYNDRQTLTNGCVKGWATVLLEKEVAEWPMVQCEKDMAEGTSNDGKAAQSSSTKATL